MSTSTTTVSFSMTVPTTLLPVIEEAFCQTYGYAPTLPDGTANPITPGEFTRLQVVGFIQNVVEAYQANQAATQASAAALAAAQQQTALIT